MIAISLQAAMESCPLKPFFNMNLLEIVKIFEKYLWCSLLVKLLTLELAISSKILCIFQGCDHNFRQTFFYQTTSVAPSVANAKI